MRMVALGLGVSDVGLTKACRAADIPVRPRGYWAKLQHGKPVPTQPPLPDRPKGQDRVVIAPPTPQACAAAQGPDRYRNRLGGDRLATVEADGTVTWLHTNHQGSVIATSNASGAVRGWAGYSPSGELNAGLTAPPPGSPFGYTGRQWDAETGLWQYRARYYSPRLGQFLSTDPIGMRDDPNLYLYVGLDPVNNTDPTGKESPCITFQTGCWGPPGDPETARREDAAGRILFSVAVSAAMALPDQVVETLILRAAAQSFGVVRSSLTAIAGTRARVAFSNTYQSASAAMRRVEGILKGLNLDDFRGVMRETRNRPTGFDHVTEMRQKLQGLENATQRINRALRDTRLTPAQSRVLEEHRDAAERTASEMRRALRDERS